MGPDDKSQSDSRNADPKGSDHCPNPAHGAPPSTGQQSDMAQHGGQMNPNHRNHGDGHH